jgi:hypothetical protein
VKVIYKGLPFFIAVFFLGSCGKTETVTQTKYITIPSAPQIIEVPRILKIQTPAIVDIPGTVNLNLYQVPQDIESDDSLKSLKSAFAKVIDEDGGMGSGFFISEDGLFLTNDHVLSHKKCMTNTYCPGFKIVSGYTEDGYEKVYSDFEVVAYSDMDEKLDAMLIKVKLNEGEKTPFVELEDDENYYKESLSSANLFAVGHPAGAPLRISQSHGLEFYDGNDLDVRALVFGGNSGGAIVDKNTKKVVGLVKQKGDHIRFKEENGEFIPLGRATSVESLLKEMPQIKNLTQEFNDELVSVEIPQISLNFEIFKGLAYHSENTFDSINRAFENEFLDLFSKVIGGDLEQRLLEVVFQESDKEISLNTQLLKRLLDLAIKRGQSLELPLGVNLKIEEYLQVNSDNDLGIRYNFFEKDKRNFWQNFCLESLSSMLTQELNYVLDYFCFTVDEERMNSRMLEILSLDLNLDETYSKLMVFALTYQRWGNYSDNIIQNINELINHNKKESRNVERSLLILGQLTDLKYGLKKIENLH